MVNSCVVIGCKSRSTKGKGIGFYRLPAVILHQGDKTYQLSKERRDLWLERINRKDLLPSEKYAYTRVCSRHFMSGKPSALYETRSPDWAPSLHLRDMDKKEGTGSSKRRSRSSMKGEDRKREVACDALLTLSNMDSSEDGKVEPKSQECQTEMCSLDILKLEEESKQLKELQMTCEQLKLRCLQLERAVITLSAYNSVH